MLSGLLPDWLRGALPDLGFLDAWTRPGPIADVWAATALGVMVVASVAVIRGGHWIWRVALVLAAASWPLPDHPAQGPILLDLSYQHGVHAADLLSIVAVVVAVLPWRRIRGVDRRGSGPSGQHERRPHRR